MKMQNVNDKQSLMNELETDIRQAALCMEAILKASTAIVASKKKKVSAKTAAQQALYNTLIDLVGNIKTIQASSFIAESSDIDALGQYIKNLETTYHQWLINAKDVQRQIRKNPRGETNKNHVQLKPLLLSITDKMDRLKNLFQVEEQETLRKRLEVERIENLRKAEARRIEEERASKERAEADRLRAEADKLRALAKRLEEEKTRAEAEERRSALNKAEELYIQLSTTQCDVSNILSLPGRLLKITAEELDSLKKSHQNVLTAFKKFDCYNKSNGIYERITAKNRLAINDIKLAIQELEQLLGLMPLLNNRIRVLINNHQSTTSEIKSTFSSLHHTYYDLEQDMRCLSNHYYSDDGVGADDHYLKTRALYRECQRLSGLVSDVDKFDSLVAAKELMAKSKEQREINRLFLAEYNRSKNDMRQCHHQFHVLTSLAKLDHDAPEAEKTKFEAAFKILNAKFEADLKDPNYLTLAQCERMKNLTAEAKVFMDNAFKAIPEFTAHLSTVKKIANEIITNRANKCSTCLENLLFKDQNELGIMSILNEYALATKSLFSEDAKSDDIIRSLSPEDGKGKQDDGNQPPPALMYVFARNCAMERELALLSLLDRQKKESERESQRLNLLAIYHAILERKILHELQHNNQHSYYGNDINETEVKKELKDKLQHQRPNSFHQLLEEMKSFVARAREIAYAQEHPRVNYAH